MREGPVCPSRVCASLYAQVCVHLATVCLGVCVFLSELCGCGAEGASLLPLPVLFRGPPPFLF